MLTVTGPGVSDGDTADLIGETSFCPNLAALPKLGAFIVIKPNTRLSKAGWPVCLLAWPDSI